MSERETELTKHPARAVRPAPRITPQTASYWKAARDGQLLLGTCADCHKLSHPPQSVCPFCWSSNVGTRAARGTATLNAFTLVYQSAVPAFRERLPYAIGYVELDEGVFVFSNIVNCDPDKIAIGMPLKAVFEKLNEESGAVLFEPA